MGANISNQILLARNVVKMSFDSVGIYKFPQRKLKHKSGFFLHTEASRGAGRAAVCNGFVREAVRSALGGSRLAAPRVTTI